MTTRPFQDILDELEQRKANPTLKDRWEDYIYYPLLRLWRDYNPRQLYREVKYFLQRGRRGWADCDTWSLDAYLAGWLPAALRHLAKHTHGYPSEFYVEGSDGDLGFAKWQAILEKMALGFEAHQRVLTYKYTEKDEQLFQEGSELFIRWFSALWD